MDVKSTALLRAIERFISLAHCAMRKSYDSLLFNDEIMLALILPSGEMNARSVSLGVRICHLLVFTTSNRSFYELDLFFSCVSLIALGNTALSGFRPDTFDCCS